MGRTGGLAAAFVAACACCALVVGLGPASAGRLEVDAGTVQHWELPVQIAPAE